MEGQHSCTNGAELKFGAFVAQILGQFWSNVCDRCVPEKIDKSVIYTARSTIYSRVLSLILRFSFYRGWEWGWGCCVGEPCHLSLFSALCRLRLQQRTREQIIDVPVPQMSTVEAETTIEAEEKSSC